jgi:hypothetical protein
VPHESPLSDAVSDLPVVSVVIPCYNAGDTLLETVESALASKYERLEVIVVDDGSTDEVTRVALDSLPGCVLRVEQPNSGLPAARNAGVWRASGSFILPLDADDLIEPDYVPEAVDAMTADDTLGIVYCRATKFGEVEGDWALPDFDVDRILVENCIFSCAMFRRDDWAAVGGYDETMRRGPLLPLPDTQLVDEPRVHQGGVRPGLRADLPQQRGSVRRAPRGAHPPPLRADGRAERPAAPLRTSRARPTPVAGGPRQPEAAPAPTRFLTQTCAGRSTSTQLATASVDVIAATARTYAAKLHASSQTPASTCETGKAYR